MAAQNYQRETSIFERQSRAAAASLGSQLVAGVAVVGSLLAMVAVHSPDAYFQLIREDGLVEHASALCWALAVATGLLAWKHQKRLPILGRAAAALLILFCGVCGGEEISWGQRIFGFAGPEGLIALNRQQETNLHNIGSISVFSNLFFLITLVFFLGLPYLQNRRATRRQSALLEKVKAAVPQVPDGARNVFLVGLVLWLFVGLRFGTLGFHPLSLWGYYTQMDDEIFELFAAYSFFAFGLLDWRRARSLG